MNYFSGFCLQGEESLFKAYLEEGSLNVAGFSFGAQKAFDYVYESTFRINRLILLSPAFFQTQNNAFVRTQIKHFHMQKEKYTKQFLNNVSYPSSLSLESYVHSGTKEELKALLTYIWDKNKLQTILDKGVKIEVFLGGKDKIINAQDALAFFSKLTTTYYHKDAGHLLQYVQES